MRAPAHISFALATATFSASLTDTIYTPDTLIGGAVCVIVGSLVCDLDTPQSPISKVLPFISAPLRRLVGGHRTYTHSLLGVVVMAVLFHLGITGFSTHISHIAQPTFFTTLFTISAFSHVALDVTTKRGCPLLLPILPNPFGFPTILRFRFTSGNPRSEWAITILSLCAFTFLLGVAEHGLNLTIANTVGGFEHLKSIYTKKANVEFQLTYKGYDIDTKESLEGIGIILSAEENAFYVFTNNTVIEIGDEAGHIHMLSGTITPLATAPQVETIVYRNETMSQILSDIKSRLVSGTLSATTSFEYDRLYQTSVVRVTGSSVVMKYASASDIETLDVREKVTSEHLTHQQLLTQKATLDSLIHQRQVTADLFSRDLLYDKIAVQRKTIAQLETQLQSAHNSSRPLLFSGRLSVRTVIQ